MHPRYPHVFSPIRLGPVELPNRYYFSPHGVALTVGSKPSNDLVAYAVERVRDGGCGLVILSCTVHERGRHYQPCPYPPENVPAFRALAEAVHAAGGKIFAQLWYWWGANGHWEPLGPPAPALGPSPAQFAFGGRSASTHALGREEIARWGEVWRQSVANLRDAGFDGVELHASHGGMLEQFLSPYFNRRCDEYGGGFENRLRLLTETIAIAREAAGPDMAVGMRFNCDELLPGGYDTGYAREVLGAVCGRGLIDFVDLDVAIEPNQLYLGMPTVFVEEQVYGPYVAAVRDAAGDVPVLSVLGRLTEMGQAEAAIASGLCDVVGSARQLIAEPRFVSHARAGTEALGRTCIACNWCLSSLGDGAQGCAINPASYRERRWGVDSFTPAAKPSKVVVVGGGPAGLEAARVAALRGHEVTLIDARAALGGALKLWAELPGRELYGRSIAWWARELERLGVAVRLGAPATAAGVLALAPDAVILATGARFSRGGRSALLDQEIPGAEGPGVFTPEDILLAGARPAGRVVLLDGEGTHASLGVAELLAAAGCEVRYLTPGFAPYSARVQDAFEAELVVKRLLEVGVRFSPQTWARRIGAGEVVAYQVATGREETLQADAVVLATGREPVDELAAALEGKVAQLFTVGDALAVRPLATAAYEGQKFARLIGEPDAPRTLAEAYFRNEDLHAYPAPADA